MTHKFIHRFSNGGIGYHELQIDESLNSEREWYNFDICHCKDPITSEERNKWYADVIFPFVEASLNELSLKNLNDSIDNHPLSKLIKSSGMWEEFQQQMINKLLGSNDNIL